MHLLYLDESGHPQDPGTQFFVLAGFAVFERSTHWLESRINPIAERFRPQDPSSIEFHGSPMYTAKDDWAGVAPVERVQALVDVLSLLSKPIRRSSTQPGPIRACGCAAPTTANRTTTESAATEPATRHRPPSLRGPEPQRSMSSTNSDAGSTLLTINRSRARVQATYSRCRSVL